jgi:hypothetical protein
LKRLPPAFTSLACINIPLLFNCGGGVMSRRMGMPARMIHFKLQPPGKAFFFVMAFFVTQSIFQ